MTTKKTLKFASRDRAEFLSVLKQRVNQYFNNKGISQHANAAMIFKSILVVTIVVGTYITILLNILSPLGMLFGAIIIGIGSALVGFNISHDAIHGSYSSNKTINKILSFSFDFMGASAYLWSLDHNIIHHTFTNIPGWDGDIEDVPFVRLNPENKLRKYHQLQHIYAFILYGFTSLSWVFLKDYRKFITGHIGQYESKRHPPLRLAQLILFKGIYLFLALVLPMLVLPVPFWMIIVGFLTVHLVEGFILAIVFQLAHVMERCEFPMPDETGSMENTWAIHQMKTTTNFARKNHIINWLVGGLNFQVEHHLFPQVCHVHYPKISEIVKEVAEEYKVPYFEVPSFTKAIASHIRMLRKLGTQRVIAYS